MPILGINLGRVGYLAEIEPAEIELLRSVFENGYTVERRLMLDVRHIRGDRTVVSGIALNDAVVSHGNQPKLMPLGRIYLFHTDRIHRIFAFGGRTGA